MATDKKQNTTIEHTISQFVDAGIGLAILPFNLLQRSFTSAKEDYKSQFSSLQERGTAIEKQLKDTLAPFSLCNTLKSNFSSQSSKEAKLERLSVKIDSLVELVAELAANKTVEINAAKSTPPPAKATPRKRTSRSSTTAKPRTTRTKNISATTKKDA